MMTTTTSYRDNPYTESESFYSDDDDQDQDNDAIDDDCSLVAQSLELDYGSNDEKEKGGHYHYHYCSSLKKSAVLFRLMAWLAVLTAIFGGWQSYVPASPASAPVASSASIGIDEDDTIIAYTPSKSESGRFQPGDNSGYLNWLKDHGDEYDQSIFQPSPAGGGGNNDDANAGDGVAIHWTIDDKSSRILLAVAARAEGWVGFGLAEAGGMRGADMVLFEYESSQQHEHGDGGGRLIDSHVLSEPVPLEDDCQSWTLRRSHKTDDGYLIFEAERLLDTGDPQDRAIPTGDFPQRVIAAWGDTETVTHHEPAKKVRSSIRFRGGGGESILRKNTNDTTDDEDDIMNGSEAELAALAANEADIIIDLVVGNYTIPSRGRTTYNYAEFCFTAEQVQELLIQKVTENKMDANIINDLHLIALEPILDKESYVHHMSIAGSAKDKPSLWRSHCSVYSLGLEMIYIWDVGTDPMILPKVAGIPFGKNVEGGHRSLGLEVHYNNPEQTSGLVDNSGFRLYFTSNKRQHDLGMMQVGDPNIRLKGKPVGEGLTKHKFDCPENCTQYHLNDDIIVVQEGLHMHKAGARMVNRQMRNGKELRMSSIEYNDFYMAGQYVPPQEPFVVKPSDAFETECYYENTNGEHTLFGLSTTDEMCIAFMWYYPRSAVVRPGTFNCGINTSKKGMCVVNYTKETFEDRSGFGRTFGFRKNEEGEKGSEDAVCK